MCGIAGFIQRADEPVPEIRDMLRGLKHRGPDAEGAWSGLCRARRWRVTLGHRRLSIVDIEGGAQPMGNEDDTCQITFNGEIYDSHEHHARLERAGHRFHTRSDTECIIHHFEDTGVDGLADLDGMFAFAIWSQKTSTLTLARDRCGIKPLYWSALPDGGIAFASELLALVTHPSISRELCLDSVAEYLFRDYVPAPHTILRHVSKLSPGQWLQWNSETGTVRSGTFGNAPAVQSAMQSEPAELDQILQDAVRSQLAADVPVGVFLSGGIDSSLVAAIAQRAVSTPLQTFSIGFTDASFDESAHAKRAAEHIGSVHHNRIVSESDLLDTLPDALGCLDEPVADHSIVPTYVLSQFARQHVKVVLGGDGGDELFAGYPTYFAHRLARHYRRFPSLFRSSLFPKLVRSMPVGSGYQPLDWKLKRFILRWEDDGLARHQRWMSSSDLSDVQKLSQRPLPSRLDLRAHDDGIDWLDSVLRFDFRTYLVGSVLTKVDRASMAHGLEVRPPLLANRVTDYALRLPSRFKLHRRTTKWALKHVARRYLPESIVDRRKHGFSIPLASWLRGPLRSRCADVLQDNRIFADTLISRETFEQFLTDHLYFRVDHSKSLWALIVFDDWVRRLAGTPYAKVLETSDSRVE